MWNPVRRVAQHQFLPEQEFVVFAVVNEDKYHIDTACDGTVQDPWVGNFHVDALIKDFKAAYPELCKTTYEAKIAELKSSYTLGSVHKSQGREWNDSN